MRLTKRKFTREFKVQVCEEIEAGLKSQAQINREYQLSEGLVGKWLAEYRRNPADCFTGPYSQVSSQEARVSRLEAALGRTVLENEILRKINQELKKKLSVRRRLSSITGGSKQPKQIISA